MHSLPIYVRLEKRPVILIGSGDTADAKRRLLERAGARIVGEEAEAQLAIVDNDDAAVARLKARGILVNAVDRPDLCDFTLPAIVDRDPVLIAVGTGGASAGLAAALRQRLETLLPTHLGALARSLHEARGQLRSRWPDPAARRRAIAALIDDAFDSGALNLSAASAQAEVQMGSPNVAASQMESNLDPCLRGGDMVQVAIRSSDPDDLTLRQARLLGQADRVYHAPDIAPAILARARADASRTLGPAPEQPEPGLTVILEHADG